MEPLQFFQELFERMVGDGVKMTVWTPKTGDEYAETKYFEDVHQAAIYADSVKDRNVYFGLGVTKEDLPSNKRPMAHQICGIPGFWIDIDIYDPRAHKVSNLPQSQKDAEELIISALPRNMQPTILTHSGHGLHAFWLFKEPWMFESDKERHVAADMVKRFVLSFKYHAAMRGWKLDSVFDLARVLRVPGSVNHKVEGMPMTCKIISIKEDVAYNPEDFEKYFVADEMAKSDESIGILLSKEKNPLGLVLSAYAGPPANKFEALMAMEERFRKSWNMQRTDFKDTSLSSYEMSIATFCAGYQWTDQEIADTLVAFRIQHAKSDSDRKKALRVDYLNRTILRAKKKRQEDDQSDTTTAVIAQMSQAESGDAEPPSRKEIVDVLEAVLKVRVAKVLKYVGDDPQFELVFEDNSSVMLGPVDNLINQRCLRSILAAHKGVLVKQIKGQKWDDYASLLLHMVETRQAPREESTEKGSFEATVRLYLERVGIMKDPNTGFSMQRPFRKDGRVYLFSSDLRNWTRLNADPLTKKTLAVVAASIGLQSEAMKFNRGSEDAPRYTTRTVYDVTSLADECDGKEKLGLVELHESEPEVGAVQ